MESISQKQCIGCRNSYPETEEFWYRARRSHPKLMNTCKTCRKIEAHQHRLEHPLTKEYRREWRENHLDKAREYARRWARNNKQHVLKVGKLWRRTNPDKARAIKLARRAREHDAVGHIAAKEINDLYHKQKGLCYYCHLPVGDRYHSDHVVPLSRGGDNSVSNIVITCPHCNTSKGNKLPHEWGEGGRLL